MERIKIGRVVSATLTADNSVDTGRKYDIAANVTVEGTKAVRIEAGAVNRMDATEMHMASAVADFQRTPGFKQISTHGWLTDEEDAAIRDAVNGFIAAVEAADYSAITDALNNND